MMFATGKGVFHHSNGDIYEGDYLNCEKCGCGRYYFKDGLKFVGHFKHDKREGHGCLYNEDGSLRYDGLWAHDEKFGFGKLYLETGRYEGHLEEGIMTGYGTYYFEDGYRYEGNWLENKMHGAGMVYDVNGEVEFLGIWIDGERQDEEIEIKPVEKIVLSAH